MERNVSVAPDQNDLVQDNPKKRHFLVVFFGTYFFKFITQKIARFVIIIVLVGFIVLFIVFATKLEVQEEQVGTIVLSYGFP